MREIDHDEYVASLDGLLGLFGLAATDVSEIHIAATEVTIIAFERDADGQRVRTAQDGWLKRVITWSAMGAGEQAA